MLKISRQTIAMSFVQSWMVSKSVHSARYFQRNVQVTKFNAQFSDSNLRYLYLGSTKHRFKPFMHRLSYPVPISLHRLFTQQSISPQIYGQQYSKWQDLSLYQSIQSNKDIGKSLQRNTLLKVVSWNIDFSSPKPVERVVIIMKYLQRIFGNHPDQLVILLQEVCQISVQQILQTKWIQQNFIIVGNNPPRIFHAGIPRPAKYFTLMMIPKGLKIENSFRILLPSEMGRDAMFVDILLGPIKEKSNSDAKNVLRLCTTHLESLEEGKSLRKRQLELISQRLHEYNDMNNVIAGLVGGDMNAVHDMEHMLHREVRLKDAWDDLCENTWEGSWDDKLVECPLISKNKELDPSYGEINGHTWGYQSGVRKWAPNRFDKFMYTGLLQTVPLREAQRFKGIIRPLGRLGIGLVVNILSKVEQSGQQPSKSVEMIEKAWVSDHFGISIGVKIVIGGKYNL
jgi:tyrosyl-DNA phosphodiesterase 2